MTLKMINRRILRWSLRRSDVDLRRLKKCSTKCRTMMPLYNELKDSYAVDPIEFYGV